MTSTTISSSSGMPCSEFRNAWIIAMPLSSCLSKGDRWACIRRSEGMRAVPGAEDEKGSVAVFPMTSDYEGLLFTLVVLTEQAVESIAQLSIDAGITFEIDDIVDAVERKLPADYGVHTKGDVTCRDLIAKIAQSFLSGEIYKNAWLCA
ncbi:hypothetical protein M1P56_16955 [Streptomyces sp. HU2014]|uniref:hypothetical protein n=1 Tax=Streptomyces sp. HU2014 TaxID=2939414 RepID=UPI00200F7CBE|nr:hypothetical protein [Streptomyces sp. HU2014]UQI45924.1 hypothetical protein M1P56_16955 [Streptomyces sp. HU2014]